jgi:tetratricopeptide (TPR) repeat protein
MLRRLWRPAPPRPRTAPQLFALADRCRREGRVAEAGRLVRAGLALDDRNLTGHLLAAYLHLAARATEPARAEFRWILARDPAHPRALLGLARVALEDGDIAACREWLTRALRLYPDFPEAQALLGAVATRPVTPAVARPAPPLLEHRRLPAPARALVVLGPDGAVLAAQPADMAEHGERLSRAARLAAAALTSVRLGPPRRAVMELAEDAFFVRMGDELTLALAVPRTTPITEGLLEVNRLWAAIGQDLAAVRRVS